jgi:hypothetical protein
LPGYLPDGLGANGLAVDKLGELGNDVQPLFISVDPERDTPQVLARYVPLFHPRLIGLTGTPEQIRAVADSYMAYYAKYVPTDGGVYLIDHTGFIYLIGRSGEYLGFFPPGTSADRMVEIIRQHLSHGQQLRHDVCFWPKADIATAPRNVCFRGQSGHHNSTASCLLLTHSGSRTTQFAVMPNAASFSIW